MNIQLINGQFSTKEAIDILTQMLHVKVKFHESKINETSNEEEVKMREKRIKELQKDLYEVRNYIESKGGFVNMQSVITL
ncbi:MAG: hypothetical protein EAZ53_06525 [Bacteroidetes bacterium]|nr:MAG: hypothetical protein EAZ53_06525 [Bacteroidota bacterium]